MIHTGSVVLIVIEGIALSNSLYVNLIDLKNPNSITGFFLILYVVFIHASASRSLYLSGVTEIEPKTPEQEQQSIRCRQCQKHVHIRDHHCGFIGQCVGKNNYKFFFSYLFFIYLCSANSVTRVYSLWASLTQSTWSFFWTMDGNMQFRLVTFILTGIFGLVFTGHMLAYQLYMILNDMTNFQHAKKIKTIEYGPWKVLKSLVSQEGRSKMRKQFASRWAMYFRSRLEFILYDS